MSSGRPVECIWEFWKMAKIQIKSFFEIFLSFCIIKNPKKILDISRDKPDNLFLFLSFEQNAIYITGDKQALESAKKIRSRQFLPLILKVINIKSKKSDQENTNRLKLKIR